MTDDVNRMEDVEMVEKKAGETDFFLQDVSRDEGFPRRFTMDRDKEVFRYQLFVSAVLNVMLGVAVCLLSYTVFWQLEQQRLSAQVRTVGFTTFSVRAFECCLTNNGLELTFVGMYSDASRGFRAKGELIVGASNPAELPNCCTLHSSRIRAKRKCHTQKGSDVCSGNGVQYRQRSNIHEGEESTWCKCYSCFSGLACETSDA
eukprot:1167577-Pyramimonas_sp.AAC.1